MAKKKSKKKSVTKVVDMKKAKNKVGGLVAEFKKFITRGNVVDMSIGVVIGGAFGAIVTALTNIFLSVCTWAVPGGLKGLITVLPAANENQLGMAGIGQSFPTSRLSEFVEKGFDKTDILAHYTLHGNLYVYNGAAIIDWGAVINAAISFLIIALVLFIIIKIFASLHKARLAAEARALEEYYKKHPKERPAPVKPGIPEPTDHQLLKEIRDALKAQNEAKSVNKK